MSGPLFDKTADFSPNFEELLGRLTEKLTTTPYKTVERFCFSYDGLNFDVHRVNRESDQSFLVNATIGYMPYTVESVERREAIKTIIVSSRVLPNVRFGVDVTSKISAGGVFDISCVVKPDLVFYPLMLFMQEARPFIQLIGKYLSAPSRRQAEACQKAG
ncbi:MAG: hypothetical protein PHE27_02850 [Alphaproteobacteria bacterium]|nr:hypothetical protein [Alphaproteobacteria bacterium]